MARVESIRWVMQRHLRARPFRPFAINLENGDQVIIEHLENIAFDPVPVKGTRGSEDFYVISGTLRLFTTFSAVTSLALLDRGEES